MTLLHTIRLAAQKVGLEVHRYNIAQSAEARLFSMLATHQVDLVIDVGANDGGYGQYIRQGGYRGPLVSFEPLQAAHAALRARAESDVTWTIAPQCALGASTGSVEIFVAGNSKSSSLLPMLDSHLQAAPHSATVGTEKVPLLRLDDVAIPVLQEAQRAFLKVDTQGYEMPVLQGAGKTLERCVGVQLEMSLIELYQGQVLYRQMIDWLDQQGFDLWSVIPGFSDPSTGKLLQMDGVFFKSSK